MNAMFKPVSTSTLCASAASDTRTGTVRENAREIEGDGEEVDDDDYDSE